MSVRRAWAEYVTGSDSAQFGKEWALARSVIGSNLASPTIFQLSKSNTYYLVGIVKRLRRGIVAPICVGSNPTTHPQI